MKKTIRKTVLISKIVNQLQKYDRRIMKMAENAYKLRQLLIKLTKENDDAIRETGSEERIGSGDASGDAGQPQLSDNPVVEAVLEEQPAELPSN